MTGWTDCILGFDTSNYTTSIAAVHAQTGECLASGRMMLPVEHGQRGLRQSEALFFHVRQLPLVMAEVSSTLHQNAIRPRFVRVAASVRPRPAAVSYMPVFHAGESFAESFAIANGIPMTRTTHQEGHLSAAEHFVSMNNEAFVAVHISGGTSDVMIAKATSQGYKISLIGEGLDLHAGQFVDRVGVHLGLPFPAGPHLERLAASLVEPVTFKLPSAVREAKMSFSGPLTAATRALQSGQQPAEVASAVQMCVSRSVSKAVEFAVRQAEDVVSRVLIVGGVASNQSIRFDIEHRLARRTPFAKVEFAPREFARDNALGVARLGYLRHTSI